MAESENADPPVTRQRLAQQSPVSGALLRPVFRLSPMMAQHFHRHEFDHPGLKSGVDQPCDRNPGRQFWVPQDMFDTGSERQDRFEIRKRREQAARRLPCQNDIDLIGIADPVGPYPHVEVGNFGAECGFPVGGILAFANEQEGHANLPL